MRKKRDQVTQKILLNLFWLTQRMERIEEDDKRHSKFKSEQGSHMHLMLNPLKVTRTR